jgi:hypothetical protein
MSGFIVNVLRVLDPHRVLNVERFVCLRNPPSIVKWHRMHGLFRACYFFCERVQRKCLLGIRAFFIFERCERNTVLVAAIRVVYLRAGLLNLRLTEGDDRAKAKTIARLAVAPRRW